MGVVELALIVFIAVNIGLGASSLVALRRRFLSRGQAAWTHRTTVSLPPQP